MKRRRSLQAILLIFAILFAMLIPGCAKTDENEGGNTEGEESSKYTEGAYTLPIVSEPLTLSFMGRDSETPGTSFNTHKALIWEKVAEETGISIDWDVIPNEEYWDTVGIRLSNPNNIADIICIVGDSGGSQLVKYYDEGILLDMKPLIDKYAPNLKKFLDDNPAVKEGSTLPGGQIVAFGGMNLSKYSAMQHLIRKDWLDKFNLPVPSTPDELYTALKTFMENDANGNGQPDEMGMTGPDYSTYRQIGTAFSLSLITGGGWSVRDGKVSNEFILPEYRALLEYLKKLYDANIIPKNFDHGWDTTEEDAGIANGNLGFKLRGGTMDTIHYNNPDNSVQQNTPGAVWVPIVWKDTGYGLALPKENSTALWRTFGISKNCKDPIAAVRLFDYMLTGAGRNLEMYGIEGISYEVVDGQIKRIPGFDKTLEANTMMGNGYFTAYSTDEDSLLAFNVDYLNNDAAKKDEIRKLVDASVANVTEPYQPPMTSPEDATRVAELVTDLTTYRDEMYSKFIRGDIPLDDTEWDKYVKQMKELGADEIAAIYQKGIDNK